MVKSQGRFTVTNTFLYFSKCICFFQSESSEIKQRKAIVSVWAELKPAEISFHSNIEEKLPIKKIKLQPTWITFNEIHLNLFNLTEVF